jgi:hypothetical protein
MVETYYLHPCWGTAYQPCSNTAPALGHGLRPCPGPENNLFRGNPFRGELSLLCENVATNVTTQVC